MLAIVIASFGQSFSPDDLKGWRALQFTEREDRFQQLVGDALREVHGAAAHVAPTLGRDGSIDAWVEHPDPSCTLLGGLEGPVIIECKDHQVQPTWPATWKNILAGWSKVRTKLETQAEKGFAGKFEPWLRARTYVYCISAGIPDQQSKDELTSAIRGFLREIAPLITNVVVCDWGTVAFWLNRERRVADKWLGIGHPGITEHLEYIHSLTGMRQYLLNEHLAYVPPDAGSDTHPGALWEALSAEHEESRPGLVLYGPGGVGKTRVCLEVALRAYEQGWRVLHVSPTDESLTERELTATIAASSRPTLLCLDYIDLLQNAEYLMQGVRLVRELASRGIRLRYLANSRPMWAQATMRVPVALEAFSFLELRPTDEQNERLLQSLMNSVAPNALAKWGRQELRRVCGRRPIIALFIAREVEDRLEKGQLDSSELAAVGGGDLSAWLRRRLAQDELRIQQPESVWKASAPSKEMVAACGALVAAPNDRPVTTDATAAVLRSLGSGTDADFVVSRLVEMGWLEWHGSWLATPHDVVADEVLDQVIRDKDAVRLASLDAVLSLWECDPSAIGRLASALQRWVGAMPEGHPALEKAVTASANWLRAHAGEIGALLATGDSDRASFAIGAIFRWPPWSKAAADCWDGLLSPWIAAHGDAQEARHLFYTGLRENSLAPRLIEPAIVWLRANHEELDASFVLGPLLEWDELESAQLEEVIAAALSWLVRFSLEKEAEFVLSTLLKRPELQGESLQRGIGFAFVWLARFRLDKNARFVLPPLLERDELQKDQVEAALDWAAKWMAEFHADKDLRFVLYSVLGRSELQGAELEKAMGYALAWLAEYPLLKETGFILARLLERNELQGERLQGAIAYALAWLACHQGEKDASYVLVSLLKKNALQPEQLAEVIHSALAWLASHQLERNSQFVLDLLLERNELQGEPLEKALGCAFSWLAAYGTGKDAGFVLAALLRRKELAGDEFDLAVRYALDWLRLNPENEGVDFIFNRVLRREDASEADWLFAAGVASDWLKRSKRRPQDIDHAFNSLLRRPKILPRFLLADVIRIGLNLWPSRTTPREQEQLRGRLFRSVKHLPGSDPLRRSVGKFFSTLEMAHSHGAETARKG